MNFSSQIFFNDINHGYRAAILKKNSLWLLPFYMVVATYFYYEKVRRTMRTAIVSNLLKTLFILDYFVVDTFFTHVGCSDPMNIYVLPWLLWQYKIMKTLNEVFWYCKAFLILYFCITSCIVVSTFSWPFFIKWETISKSCYHFSRAVP